MVSQEDENSDPMSELNPVTSDETEQGEEDEEQEQGEDEEQNDGNDDGIEGDNEKEVEDREEREESEDEELTEEDEKDAGYYFLKSTTGSPDRQFEFLNLVIGYRSEYLIYPFESEVAIDDFIKNWIQVDITKWDFEMLIEDFWTTDLEGSDDVEPVEKMVTEMTKKIFVTDKIERKDIAKRFLERLTDDVGNQIIFLDKIIEYSGMTQEVTLPVNGLPPIDDLIKNWLKVEVTRGKLQEVILALRRKYMAAGSRGEKITDLTKEDQKAIQLVEKIWGPVFGTENTTNDENGMESSTDG